MPKTVTGPFPSAPPSYNQQDESQFRRELQKTLIGITSKVGAAIDDPTGGGVQDAEARTAIIAILDLLRGRGEIA